MAVPRSRLSNARKNIRRAHHAKSPKLLINCSACGKKKLPHCICQSCGSYGERQVFQKTETTE